MKLKKAVLRRDSINSDFKNSNANSTTSSSNTPTVESLDKQVAPPSPKRTADDEHIEIHRAEIKPLVMETRARSQRFGNSRESIGADDYEPTPFEDFMERLNINKIANFLRVSSSRLVNKILSSQYINNVNDGKVHIHSFGLGVAMTSIVVMIQPLIVVYLDSWVILLGKLFKHLMAWFVVGAVLSYILNPKKKAKKTRVDIEDGPSFKELQYSVKSSDTSSPTRRSIAGASNRPSAVVRRQTEPYSMTTRKGSQYDGYEDQQALINMTAHAQTNESHRMVPPRPKTAYDHFMEGAFKKEEDKEAYNRFVDLNREDIRRQTEYAFSEK